METTQRARLARRGPTITTRRFPLAVLSMLQAACAADVVATSDPAAHARSRLARMVREQELAGVQYVAVDADRTLLDTQLGVTDVQTGQPMQRTTLQMTYSVTKVVTALAIMQLSAAGKLDLDDPLSRHWPTHPYGTSITLRSLLAHTAGIPNPLPLDWFSVEGEPLDREAALRAILAKHPQCNAAVGEAHGYSNIAYWLLEKVIESVSGRDYAQYVEQHVFAPLAVPPGASTFSPDGHRAIARGHSRRFAFMNLFLYAMTPARYWVAPHRQWSRAARVTPYGRGYGGLFTSASALAAVMQDLLRSQPKLLSVSAREQMFTEQRTRDGKPIGGTLGWVIGELNGVRYFGKQGGGLGFHGNVRIYPRLGLATVLLGNRTEVTAGAIDARSDDIDAGFVAQLR